MRIYKGRRHMYIAKCEDVHHLKNVSNLLICKKLKHKRMVVKFKRNKQILL